MKLAFNIFTISLLIGNTIAQNNDVVQVCKSQADVVAVLDSSGSVGVQDYEELKKFVGFVANLLTINENGNRLGVVTYSETAEVDFNLNEIYDSDQYGREALTRLSVRPREFKTNHYAGLKVGSDLLFNKAAGARDNAAKFLIFTTDGRNNFDETNNRNRASQLATQLKADGVNIYVIKAEVMSDNNGRLDSRLYSTDPNKFYRFINRFGEITNENFLDEVGLEFCELVQLPDNQQATVREDRNIGTLVTTIRAPGLNNPTFELIPQDNLPFIVDPLTGEIKTIGLLDFEQVQQYVFQVRVRATNPDVEKIITVTINVLDVNDNDPIPETANYRMSVAETTPLGQRILTVKANDPDGGTNGNVEYFLISGGDGKFEVDQATGEIRLIGQLNKRIKDTYLLTLEARDMGIPTRKAPITVAIDVTSLNNFPPQFNEMSFVRTIPENFGAGTVINAAATDRDGDTMVYSLIGENIPFSIDQNGLITVSGNIDFETIPNNVFQFQVQAEANGDLVTQDVIITITDINDNVPVYSMTTYSGSINENSAAGTVVNFDNVIIATDADKTNANNMITYNIIDGNDGDRFQVTKNERGEAVISLKSTPLDQETQGQYRLTLQAIDNGVDPRSLEMNSLLIIDVIDQNDNDPIPEESVYSIAVAETSPVGQSILTVRANDADSGMNGKVEYFLISGGDGKFQVDQATGQITLIGMLNKRVKESYTLNIEARDMGVPTRNAPITVNIDVTSLNSFLPEFAGAGDAFERTIPENFGSDTVIKAAATDGDGDMVFYSLVGDNLPFAIDQNGMITISGSIDFETIPNNPIRFQVKAEANGDMTLKDVVITITDVNDVTPEFTQQVYAGKIEENSQTETVVRFDQPVIATDGDKSPANNVVTYRIVDGNVDNIFKIVKNAQGEAVISVNNAGLDREILNQYTLTIEAKDNGVDPGSLSSTTQVIIDIEDVNDIPPLINTSENKAVGEADFTATISEDSPIGTSVVKVEATDPDSNNDDLIFTIANDVPVPFTIDPKTGLITVSGPLDADDQDEFEIAVTVSDGVNNSTAIVKVNIADLNDNKPIFTTDTRDITIPLDTPNGQEIIKFTGSDADKTSPNNQFEFSLVDGDGKPFTITPDGSLIINGPLMPGDYMLTVKIMDKGTNPGPLSNVIIYNVKVVDTNDPPTFQNNEQTVTISENTADGTDVITFAATDPNGDAITYEIVNPGSVPFEIDPITGVIRKMGLIDFESPVRSYTLDVKATDAKGKSTMGRVFVQITDFNDNTPTFGPGNTDNFILTEGVYSNQLVSSFTATDLDATSPNNVFEYTLVGAPSMFLLTTNPNTGAADLTVNGDIDAEQNMSFNFIIRATDKGNPALSMDYPVTITVGDINDNAPVFAANTPESIDLMEGDFNNQIVATFTANDDDTTAPNNLVDFELVGAPDFFKLIVNPETGTADLVIDGNVDIDGLDPTINFIVRAKDGGNPALVKEFPLTVNIADINDNAPVFTLEAYNQVINENTPIGTKVVEVRATDSDSGPNGDITYRIVDGDGTFGIDPKTGDITVLKNTDFESGVRSYEFTVEASDNGNPKQSATAKVKIDIRNLNDNDPIFTSIPITGNINENRPAGSVVQNIQPVNGILNQNNVKILREPPPGAQETEGVGFDAPFEIDPVTGEVKSTRPFDFEEEKVFTMMVQAADGDNNPMLTTMTVMVNNLNDNDPIMKKANFEITLNQDTPVGTFVLQVQATDIDQENQTKITYSIINIDGGNMNDFTINPDTGVITLNTDLSMNTVDIYNITIQAEDQEIQGVIRRSTALAEIKILRPAEAEPDISTLCTNSCDIPEERLKCLDYSKFEITRKFNGTCYVDKLKAAIADVKNNTMEIMNLNASFLECRNKVQNEITNPNTQFPVNGLFDLHRKCTVAIECKLEQLAFNLMRKTTELTNNLKAEEEGFSMYDMSLSAFFQHISKMVSMSKSSRVD